MSTTEQKSNEIEHAEQYFFIGAALLLGVAYMFSPLLSYVGALLCLTVFSSRINTVPRVALSVVGILSGASIGASRLVGRGLSDDFAWYYDIYRHPNIVQWTERIPRYEVGLPI